MTRPLSTLTACVSFRTAAPALAVLALTTACGGAPPADPMAGGAPPPMPVEIVTMAAAPVERTDEFVAVIKSRRSVTVQPQAEGFLTEILVESGGRVTPGTAMFGIDASPQRAAVASLQSQRAAAEADATFARQQAQRSRTMFDAGAISRQEFEQADAARQAADARLQAIEEQIRQQQAELAYFQVTAPTAGVVGDVPVRVGDRVTRGTVLTTLEDNSGLEVYVSVPVQHASRLRIGMPLRLLGESSADVVETRVSFIASSVDDATQTVLVKAPVTGRAGRFRADQYVRAELVWSAEPALTIPVVAVQRVSGRYFAFVAVDGDAGLVASQRLIELGPIVGNAYIVTSGLAEGDRLIVGGTQMIGDGAPVQPMPPPGAGDVAAPGAGS